MRSGGIFDCDTKRERLIEVERQLADPELWSDRDKSRELGRERAALSELLKTFEAIDRELGDTDEMITLAAEEGDEAALDALAADLQALDPRVAELEFGRMFSREQDPANAFLNIQAGSGGTEAQDWAEMMLRMYLRWCERRGFKTELVEQGHGEVAGIRSATLRVVGELAYGWLRTETGVHRLVRKSPFDSGNRRHTSFASVFVAPELDETIEIDIQTSDLRVDTYRASGAGGQHVNKTDSAVRITHLPSGIVVQCQNQRSQHQNRDSAMRQLRARLYEIESRERDQERQTLEASKSDIGWGSQIRSYVLDASRIKDLRTGVETSNCTAVLDGDLDPFITVSLKQGL